MPLAVGYNPIAPATNKRLASMSWPSGEWRDGQSELSVTYQKRLSARLSASVRLMTVPEARRVLREQARYPLNAPVLFNLIGGKTTQHNKDTSKRAHCAC